jgi:hypothetical protein
MVAREQEATVGHSRGHAAVSETGPIADQLSAGSDGKN